MDLNKNLGTRHRAGVGISEVTDSFTIIVSEETGNVSYASGGELHTAVTPSDLREQLHKIQKPRKNRREERMAYPRNASESGGREEMKKKILKKLLNNLPLKILSILISIVIWYVVVSVNDPIVKERFDVPVQVTNEAYIAAGKKTVPDCGGIPDGHGYCHGQQLGCQPAESIGYHRHGRSDPDCDDGYKPGLCAD